MILRPGNDWSRISLKVLIMKKKVFFLLLLVISVLLFSADVKPVEVLAKDQPTLVWITETGTKYHKRDCRTLKNSKTVKPITIEEAVKLGYEACKVCKPAKE